MVLMCTGALLIGVAASFMVPLLPFAGVLSIPVAGLFGAMALRGYGLGQICLAAIALFAMAQVGYGGGMIIDAVCRPMRKPSGRRMVEKGWTTTQPHSVPRTRRTNLSGGRR